LSAISRSGFASSYCTANAARSAWTVDSTPARGDDLDRAPDDLVGALYTADGARAAIRDQVVAAGLPNAGLISGSEDDQELIGDRLPDPFTAFLDELCVCGIEINVPPPNTCERVTTSP
jgi:hypothetical protein